MGVMVCFEQFSVMLGLLWQANNLGSDGTQIQGVWFDDEDTSVFHVNWISFDVLHQSCWKSVSGCSEERVV